MLNIHGMRDIIKTRWVVITGAPSSGKTTLIKSLALTGYKTVPDIARSTIEKYGSGDCPISDKYIQTEIVERLIEVSRALNPGELVIFDYGMPDNLVFHELLGLDINLDACEYSRMIKYAAVFLCDPLPFVLDGIRDKDESRQILLHEMIKKSYVSLGYEVHHLPPGEVSDRLRSIKKELEAI
jgi:predicted ATPase